MVAGLQNDDLKNFDGDMRGYRVGDARERYDIGARDGDGDTEPAVTPRADEVRMSDADDVDDVDDEIMRCLSTTMRVGAGEHQHAM